MKATFVYELMMMRTQQHQVIEAGFAARRPVFYVVGIDEARVVTTRKHASSVSCPQRSFDRRGYGTRLATHAEWIAVFVFNNDNGIAVTTQAFDRL